MIPASTPYEAALTTLGKGGPNEITFPVLAWDDEGHALIADTSAGKLVRASENPNFGGLRPARHHAVGVIPGGGYRIVFKQQDGPFIMDVLAWVVDADRYAVPLYVIDDGAVFEVGEGGEFEYLLAPGEEYPGGAAASESR